MESINRPKLIKEHNLNLVRQQLFQAQFATRQQLSTATGISNVTMGSLLSQLLENGEALEMEKVQPASGRPASVYSYNACRQYILLLSVGFVKIDYRFRAELIDLYGSSHWREERPTACLNYHETLEYLDRLTQIKQPVGAVGVGLPGVGFGEYLYKSREKHTEYLSLAALEDFQREKKLPIQVENDVNLAAVGYAKRHGIGKGECLVYLYLMQGCFGGSAVYLDGRLHLGKGRFAGELLPPPYGSAWFRIKREDPEELIDALFTTILPYLAILAPHHLVVASDYIQKEHLRAAEKRLSEVLEDHCPEFSLTENFWLDYQKGLEQITLEQLPFPVGQGKPEKQTS